MTSYKLLINDKEEMSSFAKKISDSIKGNAIIFLNGDLGAGKTFFASEFIKYRLDSEALNITSPTFPLVNTYKNDNTIINHCDFYRIDSIDDLMQIGIDDILRDTISIIEWQKFCHQIVIPDIIIDIDIVDVNKRSIKCQFNVDK